MQNLRHLLGIRQLNVEQLQALLANAETFVEVSEREIKKVPALRGKTVVNLFLEPSTRTIASFDIAGKRLSADTINISGGSSSVVKGETLLDTARTIEAMNPDILVVRHKESGAPHFLAACLGRTSVVNGGDGTNEHPTQALLDCLTLRQHFKPLGRDLEGLKVAIVGDVIHSRVARSNIWAHGLLGNEIRLVGPRTLVPRTFVEQAFPDSMVSIHHDLKEGLEGADVVICLRMQMERQSQHFVPNLEDYTRKFCLSERILKAVAPQSVVLHPGPMNRGIEISSEVADGPRSLIAQQVKNGVAVRMAVLFWLASGARIAEIGEAA